MEKVDLVIVGAGPAGTGAAIRARQHGQEVVLIDKASFPRDKTCGDGLTAGAIVQLKRVGVEITSEPHTFLIARTQIRSPNGRVATLPTDGLCAVCTRSDLDNLLHSRAKKAGAVCIEGSPVSDISVGEETVTTKAGDETFVSTYAIAADGAYSPTRKLLGVSKKRPLGEYHAFRQYFSGVETRDLWVIFDRDLLPGYAWIFPLPGNRANVGFGIERTKRTNGKYFNQLAETFAKRPHVAKLLAGATPDEPMRAWPIPAHVKDSELTHGRVMFAGDAASLVDPLTGEGIGQAIFSGIAAADAVLTDDPMKTYQKSITKELKRDHQFARLCQILLRNASMANAGMRVIEQVSALQRPFARWMFEDAARGYPVTPRRWFGRHGDGID